MASLFNIFSRSSNKKDIGLTKADVKPDKKFGISYFFRLLKIRWGNMTTLNLLFILLCLPVLLTLLGYYLSSSAPTPQSPLYASAYGISLYEGNIFQAVDFGIYGIMSTAVYYGTLSKVLLYSGLLVVFTFGFANVGMIYVLRNISKGNHVFTLSDFWSSIKRNFRQALFFGVLDAGIIALLVMDIILYQANAAVRFVYGVMFLLIIVIFITYLVMRIYIYLMIVTFDVPIYKMIKNSFIFSILGFKRNITALVGMALVILANYLIIMILPSVGILLPVIFTVSLVSFIGVYCEYPIILKYMTSDDGPADNTPAEEVEKIFHDHG